MSVAEVPNIERDKLLASIENLKRVMPTLIEHAGLQAQLRFASFDAHVKAGFTPEQALKLCTVVA